MMQIKFIGADLEEVVTEIEKFLASVKPQKAKEPYERPVIKVEEKAPAVEAVKEAEPVKTAEQKKIPSVDDMRAAFIANKERIKTDELKARMSSEYKVSKMSDIPEDRREEFIEMLNSWGK